MKNGHLLSAPGAGVRAVRQRSGFSRNTRFPRWHQWDGRRVRRVGVAADNSGMFTQLVSTPRRGTEFTMPFSR